MKKPKYGDAVKIKSSAPERYRPGNIGSVFSMTESPGGSFESKTGVPKGEIALGIEFSDGESFEVPITWVEAI